MLGSAGLAGLKPNVWYRLHLEVHDKLALLNVNGETLLRDVELDAGGGSDMLLADAAGQSSVSPLGSQAALGCDAAAAVHRPR